MEKILKKYNDLLIYVFFIIYLLVNRINATDSVLFYSICLILGALVLPIFIFKLNNDIKDMEIKRFHLGFNICFSLYVILQSIDYMLSSKYAHLDTYQEIRYWILNFSHAFYYVCFVMVVFYLIKKLISKKFKVDVLDIRNIKALIDELAMIFISIVFFNLGKPSITTKLDNHYQVIGSSLIFDDFNIILKYTLIISFVYLIIYFILDYVKNNILLKEKDDPNQRKFN